MEAGHEVAYMHGMVHAGNVVARNGRSEYWFKGLRREAGANVFTPLSLIPYSKVFPFDQKWAAQASYLSCWPTIKSTLQKVDFQPDIIWSANPGSIALRKIFPKARFFFQVVDYYPAFSGAAIKKIERADYHGSDHIFVIGDTLKEYLRTDHNIEEGKITVLGQGVFTEAYQQELSKPIEYEGLAGPIAVWVGVLNKCDPGMFEECARVLSSLGGTLVLIGPTSSWESELIGKYGNVISLGPKTPDQVPAYLQHASIGLMLYDQTKQEVYKGQNPLKLYEYAAAGLPILSTPHDEYAYIDPPALIVDKESDVEPMLKKALANREALGEDSREFVSDRDWQKIYKKIESYFLS